MHRISLLQEAEFAGLFHNAKDGAMIRNILNELGWPQPPTPIQTDNSCAAGITNGTIRQQKSKAMDMRFYWVQDRVATPGTISRLLAQRRGQLR
jgi:hypothetical protein